MSRREADIPDLVMHARYANKVRPTNPELADLLDLIVDRCSNDWEGDGQDLLTDIVALRIPR